MRDFGRVLALKARLQIADGRLDDALGTIQTGYALARDVAQGQTLINALVGMAISATMDNRLEELIQQPGAPNLYWALTALPKPLIDPRPGMEMEMNMVYLAFPELRDIETRQRSPEEWRELMNKLGSRLSEWSGMLDNKPSVPLMFTAMALAGYPEAKRSLIARGRTPAEVEAMPVAQVVAIHTVSVYNEYRDEIFKWFYVPYWQSREGIREAERELQTGARGREIIPFARLLLPAIAQVNLAVAKCDRRIAALRTIEALRMYAAAHHGTLPAKLADVTQAPAPADPITGQPFAYHLQGDTAILEGFAPSGTSAKSNGLRYEITLVK